VADIARSLGRRVGSVKAKVRQMGLVPLKKSRPEAIRRLVELWLKQVSLRIRPRFIFSHCAERSLILRGSGWAYTPGSEAWRRQVSARVIATRGR
jgi:hypothetical protein